MDSQSFNYWVSQSSYVTPPHQTTIFELPPDLSKVHSPSGSPVSSTYDHFPAPIHQSYYPQIADEPMPFGNYPLPMTPSEFGSDHDSPYGSPRPPTHAEPVFAQTSASGPGERTHTTSGKRRAQNRAAQRAFRERKEKHARDLEIQLGALTDKYNKLEASHTELNASHDKLRKTIELLTYDDDDDAEGEIDDGRQPRRRNSNSDTLRKLLEILHGEFKGVAVKRECT
ncbi:hypothetical protein K504DRAFT_450757 [Pleomassaria siparia CBS 279.74]|uniref:BZIP domain-containing protein n=1 Tax=Pleomassaria siparia CBS 279.74 TaxID=1314801 RepID=A0A6G1KPC0_9PLEO|nr:hypothetical protein K504DRAFT_450757 [Pleomassaria siparia CBS 279.74]